MSKPRRFALPFFAAAILAIASPAGIAVATESSTARPANIEAVRAEFLAALQRSRAPEAGQGDSPALRAYPIYDYLVAARLRRDLQLKANDELDVAIDAFLQAHGKQPVGRTLRHDWLISLSQRQRWDWFLSRSADASDPILLCDRLEAKLQTGDTRTLGADALVRWNMPQQPPHECDAAFAWLHQQGLTTPALAAIRTRAALAAENPRLAREFATELPPAMAAPLLQWAQLLENPRPILGALAANPNVPVEADALDAGLNRLARSDPAAALQLLPRLLARAELAPGLRGRLQRDVALGAAYSRDPDATAALAAVPSEATDDEVRQWRARAALWNGDFDQALRTIEQMPAGLAAQTRWRYWHARAVAATSSEEAATRLYSEVAGQRDYYGYLASDRLHHAYTLNAQPSLDDQAAQAALAARPGMMRARALFECNMWDEAVAEWANELADADTSLKVQAAHLAVGWGWYAQAIATLAQSGEWDDVRLRYPRPYGDAVADASARTQLPGDWIMAVMRQESLFRSDALSRAGARGLMQLRPSTAMAVARRWQLPAAPADALYDPTRAIVLGAAYLREMLDHYGGQLGPALAAYNAGTAPVARWMPNRPMDADIWIENIAYGETRDYLQRVFEHIIAYAWVRDAEPPRLVSLLPPISPTATVQVTSLSPSGG